MRMRYIALILAGINILVFVLQQIIPGFTDALILVPANNHVYELITSMFLHGSLSHLFFNMFALFIFGLLLEKNIGSKKFVYVYFFSGLIASFSAFIFYYNTPVLGASGAIYGAMGALGVVRPKLVVWVLGAPMPAFLAVVIWFFVSLAGIFSEGNIAHGAHLFGLITGVVFGLYYREPDETKERKKVYVSEKRIREWEKRHMED